MGFAPEADRGEGFKTSSLKHHILKRPVPERPRTCCVKVPSVYSMYLVIHYRGVQWEGDAVDGGSIT